jgi:hypothetical protein
MAKNQKFTFVLMAIVGGAIARGAGQIAGDSMNPMIVTGGKALIGGGLILSDKKNGAMSQIGAGMCGDAGADLVSLFMPGGTNAPGVDENLFFDPVNDDPMQIEAPGEEENNIFGPANPAEIVAGPANPAEIVAAPNYAVDWSQLEQE